jgi:hypothetical protein
MKVVLLVLVGAATAAVAALAFGSRHEIARYREMSRM